MWDREVVQDAKEAVARAELGVTRAELGVGEAKAAVVRAETAAAHDAVFLPMYMAAQQGLSVAQQSYLAAQEGYTAAQQGYTAALRAVISASVVPVEFPFVTTRLMTKDWMQLPPVSAKGFEIYIRECYELLYMDIQDYFALGQTFIHVSGNPGTGKSCFLWYVLARIWSDPGEQGNAVIIQLVERTFEILPGSAALRQISEAKASKYYSLPGTWLLVDQKYVGCAAAKTVLFASPKGGNWETAWEVMDERKFTSLFMPPWSLEELDVFYFRERQRTAENIIEFWVRFYLSGSIVRWYASSLEQVYSKLVTTVTEVVRTERSVNATLFRGEFSHHVFCSWPSSDFSAVDSYSFVSAFVADCFARACYRGELQNWSTEVLKMAGDRALRQAAGVLFERYAHHSLSRGGFFPSVNDKGIGLELQPRPVVFFNGRTFPLEQRHLENYLRPTSPGFPWFNSACFPDLLIQVSMAKSRKPIPKTVYDAQVASLKAFWDEHPSAPSCLRGVTTTKEIYVILVQLQGEDRTAVPEGIRVWEEAEIQDKAESSEGSTRIVKRRRTPGAVTKVAKPTKLKRKVTAIPFQMTVALKEEDGLNIDYEPLSDIVDKVTGRIRYERVEGRLYGVDPTAEEFGNMDTADVELGRITVLMRQGKGFATYEETYEDDSDGEPVFAATVTASRSDGVGETTTTEVTEVTIDCSAGQLAEKREFRILIDERRGRDIKHFDPFMIPVNSTKLVDESTGNAYELTSCDSKMMVKILCTGNQRRTSKYFSIWCSVGGAQDNSDGEMLMSNSSCSDAEGI